MQQEIDRLERKKTLSWVGLVALSAPVFPFVLLDKGLDLLSDLYGRLKVHLPGFSTPIRGILFDANNPDPAVYSQHPLRKIVDEMSQKEGVSPNHVWMYEQNKSLSNAYVCIFNENQKNFDLTFVGNPLNSKNGEEIARGVIGHELGHLKTTNGKGFTNWALNTASTYSLISSATAALGIIVHKPVIDHLLSMSASPKMAMMGEAALTLSPHSPLFLTTALCTATLAYATKNLIMQYSHATEHIADIHGAAMTSPETAIKTLEYFSAQKEPLSLRDVFYKAIYPERNTHPASSKRISLLKDTFKISADVSNPAISETSEKMPQARRIPRVLQALD